MNNVLYVVNVGCLPYYSNIVSAVVFRQPQRNVNDGMCGLGICTLKHLHFVQGNSIYLHVLSKKRYICHFMADLILHRRSIGKASNGKCFEIFSIFCWAGVLYLHHATSNLSQLGLANGEHLFHIWMDLGVRCKQRHLYLHEDVHRRAWRWANRSTCFSTSELNKKIINVIYCIFPVIRCSCCISFLFRMFLYFH